MAFFAATMACNPWQSTGGWRILVALSLLAALSACAVTSPATIGTVSQLAPLQLEGRELTVMDAAATPTPNLLAIDDAMREFVERYTGGAANKRQRLMSLHRAIAGAGTLAVQYDPFADGSAREVFYQGSANCLSYASLFVALAREAGLDAAYQWLDVRPQWSREGDRVLVGLHVNVVVKLRQGGRYMVDIDPLPSAEVAGSLELTDSDAQALHHNNVAMAALAEDDLEQAWNNGVRALQLNPQMAHLWVNLGAIYRSAHQYREAEGSYLQALELDPWSHPAMTNLAILYGLEDRQEDRAYWLGRVERYRQSNPFYHAWLGDQAGKAGEWPAALEHYEAAVELSPRDSGLRFARGMIHYQLDDLDAAAADIQRAIELATLRSEVESYQAQLARLRQEQLVAI